MTRWWTWVSVCLVLACAWSVALAAPTYNSPYDTVYSPDGKLLAVSDRTANVLTLIDVASGKIARQAALHGRPGRVAWSANSGKVFVTEYNSATVAEVDAATAKVARRMPTGAYPMGVAVAAKRQLLLVSNLTDVVAIDLASGKEKGRVKMIREPFCIALTPDESMAIVSNLLPDGSAAEPTVTAAVSLIDVQSMKRVADIHLPPNTTAVRFTAVSPDGKWGYAVHTVGRTMLPATQLERGWVNTNAMSVIDLAAKKLYATVLLDNLSEGAADPWGIALSKDGATMWITLAGTSQLARLDMANLHKHLAGDIPQPQAAQPAAADKNKPAAVPVKTYTSQTIWNDIKADPAKRADLVNDLAALYVANLISRIQLPGNGPRGLDLSPDGKQLAVGQYFSGDVVLLDPGSGKVCGAVAVGPKQEPDEVRRGEIYFHDAHYAFQHWLSCASCHPNEGRVDGLNWDLPNDGIGNPKNARNLLYAHKTPPSMSLGIREGMEEAASAGFRFAMHQPAPEVLKAVQAYIRSLKPDVSPHRLANGEFSEKAKKGKAIFESARTACSSCHSGEVFTNLKQDDVGTHGPLDHKEHTAFDTPMLIELWRTAPYLHDGRANTLQELLTKFNPKDQHGHTSHLSKEEIDCLVEYLLSL